MKFSNIHANILFEVIRPRNELKQGRAELSVATVPAVETTCLPYAPHPVCGHVNPVFFSPPPLPNLTVSFRGQRASRAVTTS
jgi:hypothetical protein